MKWEFSRKWLAHQLKQHDDSKVGAGGTTFAELERDVARRIVTPIVLADVPSPLGKAIRFSRSERGLSVEDLAVAADVDAQEILQAESLLDPTMSVRSISKIARVLGFSPKRLQQLAGHTMHRAPTNVGAPALAFAARSKGAHQVTDDEYEAVRQMIEILSEKPTNGPDK